MKIEYDGHTYDVSKLKEAFPHSFIDILGIRKVVITLNGKFDAPRLKKKSRSLFNSISVMYNPTDNITKIEGFVSFKIRE